jgi:hypothetical protein
MSLINKNITRSEDVAVRKSPSVSATAYPKGYRMRGNDGNMWVIIVDNRGVHRWQKERTETTELVVREKRPKSKSVASKKVYEDDYLDKIKGTIEAMRILLVNADDSDVDMIKNALEQKIKEIEGENDKKAKEALNLLLKFKRETFRRGGEVSQQQKTIDIYKKALNKANSEYQKQILQNRISKLENKQI